MSACGSVPIEDGALLDRCLQTGLLSCCCPYHASNDFVERRTVWPPRRKGRKHGAFRPQKPLRLIRDGEVGGSGILYLTPTRYTVTTRMILH